MKKFIKRKTIIILAILLTMATATTVFAIYADDSTGKQLIKKGYTEQDINEINAITLYSDADVLGLILQKYEELGDWKSVREYYGVDEKKYQNYMDGLERWQAVLDSVPEEVMKAMENEGWSQQEINNFVNKLNIAEVDYEYAWKQYKAGKSVEEIVKEKREEDKQISELDTAYVMSDMTETEYWSALSKIKKADNTTISDILIQVKQLRTDVRNRHKIQCGITDEEIAYCESQGMTNPMDMFRAKYISSGNNVSFENVVASKLKHDDWTEATAEVLNIPVEEYKLQVENAKKE